MLVIGLTGGIGSGKTLASDAFAKLGVPVIDTDEIAREVVRPGEPALEAIAEAFGDDVLCKDGALNRSVLRERIFNSPKEREKLEAILHPRIEARVKQRIDQLNAPYCIVVIPLLVESEGYPFVDRVLVIDSPTQLQMERTMERDKIDATAVEKILASQASREERLAHANDIIYNDTDKKRVLDQVEQLHRHYLKFASPAD